MTFPLMLDMSPFMEQVSKTLDIITTDYRCYNSSKYSIYLIGVLQHAPEYYTYLTAVRIMVEGNRALPVADLPT